MNIPRRLFTQAAMTATCFLYLLSARPALCQSGPPPIPIIWLSSFSFPQTNLDSDYGYAPIGETNAFNIPFWDGNALWLDTTNEIPAFDHYHLVESNGFVNIDLAAGTIFIQVVPDWASADTNQLGQGPGSRGYLLASGDFSSGSSNGLWAIYVDAGGTNIYFGGVSNSVATTYVSAPISWATNSLHEIGVYYRTNSELFLDGQWEATGGPVTVVPTTNTWTNGFYIGSDGLGFEQFRGIFPYVELDTTNIYIYDTNYLTIWWNWDTNSYYTWLNGYSGEGGFHPDWGGFGLPPTPTNTFNSNFLAYSNFWLLVTNNGGDVQVDLINACRGLTYVILTNANLQPMTSTNWKPWVTLVGSNTVMLAGSLTPASNTLYFNAKLVWSTCTNYFPALPDWWAMLYFDSTACVNPSANPSGDGIDNWDKYLMGLNPNVAYVNQIVVIPPGGNYLATPSISIFSLSGASIKYTTNGSTPSATNGFTSSSGVPLTNIPSGNFTLKGWESGVVSNIPATATYTIIPATPTFSRAEGAYAYGTTLQISNLNTNAVVRYTTNGSNPTTNSTQIQPTNVITLLSSETIEAAAWLGTNVSPVASAAYIIQAAQGALPTNQPPNDNFSNAISFTGTSGIVAGSTLNATLESFETDYLYSSFDYNANEDGNSVWYKWVAPSNGTIYLNCFDFYLDLSAWIFPTGSGPNPTNLVPAGLENGSGTYNWVDGIGYYTMSVTDSVAYYISVSVYSYYSGPFNFTWQYVDTTATPIFWPDAGTYTNTQVVTVSENDTNSIIYFTTDGSSPSTNSAMIASGASVFIVSNTTLNAMAWRPGLGESAVKSAIYTINASATNPTLTASAPTLSPPNTNFASSLAVTITCTNAGAIVFYTMDGSIPTSASASVTNGGTVTLTNSTPFNASAWVTNMNFSPITAGWYAKNGVDTTGDGILDSVALAIGADPFVSDAKAANPNPFAHGLNNFQVSQNQSVLLANNYSTLNDGIPDWWLVQNGYSVTTPATALGANGQTLLASYLAGLNPNNPSSQPGQLPPIDFHIAHGPTNGLILVLDNVRSDIAEYFLYCTEADASSPFYNQTVREDILPDRAMPVGGQQWGRYFQLTNALPIGKWTFTFQGINTNGIASSFSTNTLGMYSETQNAIGVPGGEVNHWQRLVGPAMPVVGYTNHNGIKEAILTQILRAENDEWTDLQIPQGAAALGVVLTNATLYDTNAQSFVTEESWGTLTFELGGATGGGPTGIYYPYPPIGPPTNFPSFFATGDTATSLSNYFVDFWGGAYPYWQLTPFQILQGPPGSEFFYYLCMPTNTFNPAGLAYLSVTYQFGNDAPLTLSPGESNGVSSVDNFEVALQTETPTLQTIDYYFDARQYPLYTYYFGYIAYEPVPICGSSATPDGWEYYDGGGYGPDLVTNPVIVAQVGRTVNLQAWSQVKAIRPNGTPITNQTFWIDQDFAQAYLCDPATGDVPRTSATNYNGKYKIDTNSAVTTGILSPNLNFPQDTTETDHGWRGANFTPTQPGKVIVTTIPDTNGYYGELTIYVIDMLVDANHDGVMDNRDLTSVDNPMQFWVNNDIDRWHDVDCNAFGLDCDSEQDDLQITDSALADWQQVPDCFYGGTSLYYAEIPCTRDLEDYARLWIPGLSNLMQVLQTNYGVHLQWRNNTGAGIRVFEAEETDGGTNYLFDTTTASNQINYSTCPCLGYANPQQTISMSLAFAYPLFSPTPNDHFIFCGTASGNDELVLQVTNQWGGVVGEASVFINLKDIKQMYERWTIGDDPTIAPTDYPVIAANDLPPGLGSFQYPYDSQTDINTPYILHVHGSNMELWEKDRFAETMYKRLYWQGYQGRFGSFRWPTSWGFTGSLLDLATNSAHFDKIEYTAWQSASGLTNILTQLDAMYPGQVRLTAHSMGNVAASEALRQASSTLVDVYAAFQGAVPAHAYDTNATVISLGSFDKGEPNVYAHYWNATNAQYFAGAIGAASYVNFFNTNDFVLNQWLTGQLFKPDSSLNYSYNTTNGYLSNSLSLTFPDDTYELFSFCQQAKCNCIGEQPNLGDQFQVLSLSQQVELDGPPYNFGDTHKYHSGEFRSDNMSRAVFWNQLLIEMGLKQ